MRRLLVAGARIIALIGTGLLLPAALLTACGEVSVRLVSPEQSTPPATPTNPATATPAWIGFAPIYYGDGPPPTATPTPTATPAVTPGWLEYLNRFRAGAGLHPLTEEPAWSYGDWLHGRYMVKNDYVGHWEDANNPWYTPEGYEAARRGNTYVSTWTGTPDERVIDFWMTAPFHAISMLDPQLFVTGYDSYAEDIGYWNLGATLDVQRGREDLPPDFSFPIMFPGDGGQSWLLRYNGGEWPNPLASCPGYSPPSGPPIMLQIGGGLETPQVTGSSFSQGGTPLEYCIYDETNYTNPNPSDQNSGRLALHLRDAVVIMPRQPLAQGQSYTASVTANGTTYTWNFTTVPSPIQYAAPESGVDEQSVLPPEP